MPTRVRNCAAHAQRTMHDEQRVRCVCDVCVREVGGVWMGGCLVPSRFSGMSRTYSDTMYLRAHVTADRNRCTHGMSNLLRRSHHGQHQRARPRIGGGRACRCVQQRPWERCMPHFVHHQQHFGASVGSARAVEHARWWYELRFAHEPINLKGKQPFCAGACVLLWTHKAQGRQTHRMRPRVRQLRSPTGEEEREAAHPCRNARPTGGVGRRGHRHRHGRGLASLRTPLDLAHDASGLRKRRRLHVWRASQANI